MPNSEHQLRIHLPVEFGVQVLPPHWRRHVTYGLGTGLELRWSEPRALKRRIQQAQWSAMLEPTYNHDCSSVAWDLWAIGTLCLLSGAQSRARDWNTVNTVLPHAKLPDGYCKYALLSIEGLMNARAAKFEGAPSPGVCAGIGAAALALVIVNHVNLARTANDPQVVQQLRWLRTVSGVVGRGTLVDELEAHWRSGVLEAPRTITQSLERLSLRA